MKEKKKKKEKKNSVLHKLYNKKLKIELKIIFQLESYGKRNLKTST